MGTDIEINDLILISDLYNNINEIEFIKKTYKDNEFNEIINLIKKIKNKLEKSKDKIFRADYFKDIFDLWKLFLKFAIIHLKIKDEREGNIHDKETYGIENLSEYFKQFKKHERILYGSKETYRDHIFHMFRTFLLGEYICREFLKGFNSIEIEEIEKFKKLRNISDSEKEAMWCIISLTHDLGLPLENAHKINEPMRKMMKYYGRIDIHEFGVFFPPQSRFIDDFITRFISSKLEQIKNSLPEGSFTTEVQPKYYLKFSKEFEEYKHGIISCVLLMKNLVYFLESDYVLGKNRKLTTDDAIQFLIRREILRSIAAHCCDDIYHISITKFPFLLVISDEMQAWGRPFFEEIFEEDIPRNSKLIIHKFTVNHIDFEILWEVNKNLKCEIYKYGLHLGKKFTKILRSGVDTKKRNFQLIFRLRAGLRNLNLTQNIIKLIFSHKKPSDTKSKFFEITIKEIENNNIIFHGNFEDFEKEKEDWIKKNCQD